MPESVPDRPAALTGSRARRSVALLVRGLRDEPRVFAVAIAGSALYGAAVVALSWLLGWVTDSVVVPAMSGSQQARSQLGAAVVALVALALAMAVFVVLRRIFAGMAYANLQATRRRAVTRQYLKLPMSWHRRHPAGQLLSNAYADVEASTTVFNPFPFALGVVVMIAVSAVALLRTDVWLAVAALAVLPLVVAVNVVFQRFMSPAVTRAQELRAEVSDIAHESFEAAVVVKSMGTEDLEERRFAERTDALRASLVRVGTIRAFFDPAIDLLPNLGTLLVLVVGTVRMSAGAVEPGAVVSAAYLLTLLAIPVRAFGWVLGDLPRALVGWSRVARVLDQRPDMRDGTGAMPPAAGGARLRLDRVALGVRDTGTDEQVTLLRDVDLDLAPGRTVALVGATGSGKSTVASLTARLLDPTAGRVLLDEVDLRDLDPAEISRAVAMVGQSTFVFADTVRGNVTLATDGDADSPDDAEVWAALAAAKVDDVVRALPGQLDAELGERGSDLSGGQRQRLAIARALVRRPRLLVLDDATSAVDPRVEQQILRGLRANAETTVLLIAYRMASILLADEVVHLDAGRVVDRGSHAELLARDPGYRELATAYEREAARRAAADEEATA